MKEKKEVSSITISKTFEQKVITGLDKGRDEKFNQGLTIEVSPEEFEKLKHYRWLKWQ